MPVVVNLQNPDDELAKAHDIFHFEPVTGLQNPVIISKRGEDRIPYALNDALRLLKEQGVCPHTREPFQLEDIDALHIMASSGDSSLDEMQKKYEEGYQSTLYRLLVLNCDCGPSWRVRMLVVAAGANMSAYVELLHIAMNRGDGSLNVFYTLLEAAGNKVLLDKNQRGETALMAAVAMGNIRVVKRIHYILKYDQHMSTREMASSVNIENKTPLAIAVYKEDLPMVKLLVEGLRFPLQNFYSPQMPNHPLTLAIQKNNLELVTYLVQQKADVHMRGPEGRDALAVAAAAGHTAILEFLVTHCAMNPGDPDALRIASQNNRVKALELLLSKAERAATTTTTTTAIINKVTMKSIANQHQLLVAASSNGAYSVTAMLVKLGVDTTQAFFEAIEQNRPFLFLQLLYSSPNRDSWAIENYGSMRDTPMTWAIQHGSLQCFQHIVQLAPHFLMQARRSDNKTPKILAYESGDQACILALAKASQETAHPTAKLRKLAAEMFARAPITLAAPPAFATTLTTTTTTTTTTSTMSTTTTTAALKRKGAPPKKTAAAAAATSCKKRK